MVGLAPLLLISASLAFISALLLLMTLAINERRSSSSVLFDDTWADTELASKETALIAVSTDVFIQVMYDFISSRSDIWTIPSVNAITNQPNLRGERLSKTSSLALADSGKSEVRDV